MQEIICVLDKSGSMQKVASDAVGGFNSFLVEQKAVGPANLTLVWFDDQFNIGYEGLLQEAKVIDHWPNGGMTALLDAIGKTFHHVRDRFSREQPEKVVLAILTDGEENDSKEFTTQMIESLIKEHQDNYGWEVIFLAADQDAWATAQYLGIKRENSINYASAATADGFASYSANITRARTT